MAADILIAIIDVYTIIVIVRVVLAWLPARHRANQFYEFIYAITEPAMGPLRRLIPPISGLDFSPVVLLLVLVVIEWWLKRL